MNSYRTLTALALAGMLALSGRAFADDDAAAQFPEPQAPKHATVEDGRIETYIGTSRVADYAIGDSIPIRLVFELMPDDMYKKLHVPAPTAVIPTSPSLLTNLPAATPSTAPPPDQAKVQLPTMLDMPKIEVEGLKMAKASGQVSNQPSDVEPLTPAQVEGPYILKDGRLMVVVTMYVTTYVTTQKTQVGVVMDYSYAIARMPDGSPDWHTASTPELPIGVHTSATKSQSTLLDGDLSPKEPLKAPAAYLFTYASPFFAIPMVVALIGLLFQRVTRKRRLTKNELLWDFLDKTFEEGEKSGSFTIDRYQRIFYALRQHFDVLGMDTTAVLNQLKLRPDVNTVASDFVFNKETWFYDTHSVITDAEHNLLKRHIAELVPRR